MPPYGDMSSNIHGVYDVMTSNLTDKGIVAGDFLQFVNFNNFNEVSKSNNRFNIDMVSVSDVSGNGTFLVEVIRPSIKQTEQTNNEIIQAYVGERYICAGEFVTLMADNTLKRSIDYDNISGQALDSGKFGAYIRIKTLTGI
jgi:hypothetical protein